ncbi:TlpA family protein disulfide reductase [Cellulophaga sp. F20128]|uniref:TlpA family protein disulfide reductase n=1 Tax=Cellulophaga sp. F20128 TaxID=2926413 RepID=UPI001FF235CF|nr:TlpA disulfide reductase family protein [Cellulophaga sp. F20128]MCK0158340.1 TlpA family protein disulfide reductase [Cellulophaga sp. F20128]
MSRKKIGNIVFFVFLLVVLFTPIGFHIKVFVNKLFSFGPSVVSVEKQVSVTNYNWELVNESGVSHNFNSKQGKVVLLNFWATWCPPCVAEMPSLEALYKDYKDRVEFVFVAQDNANSVTKYVSDNNFSFPVFYSNSKRPAELVSEVIPTTYILTKDGKISVEETGAKNWNSKTTRELLDKLLKE